MSLSSAISIAQQAFSNTAQQTATVSKNIANAGNADYSRRLALLGSTPNGAQVVSIYRAQNEALLKQSIASIGEASGQARLRDGLELLKSALGGNNYETAPSKLLSDFRNSLQTLAATPGNNQVALDWNDNNPAVAGYNVWRAAVSGGTPTKINSSLLTASAYTDTSVVNGTPYFYVVRAQNSQGVESANSSEVASTPNGTDTTPPAPPVITSQTRKTKDTTPSTSGTAEPATTVRVYSGANEIGNIVVSPNGTWTVANPSALGSDGAYQITARAFDSANESVPSTAIQVTLDTTAPPATTNVRTTSYHNCVDVEWTPSTAVDVAGYKIERKTGAGSWTLLNSNLALGTRYRDTTAVNGTTYQYRVIAVDDALDY